MNQVLKKISNIELYTIIDLFLESEKVIVFSLLEKKGIFSSQKFDIWAFYLKEGNAIEGILIVVSKNAFLLGKDFININNLSYELQLRMKDCTILGQENLIKKFLGKNKTHLLIQKDFAFLEKEIVDFKHNSNLELLFNEASEKNCIAYAQMKGDFIFEESKQKLSWKKIFPSKEEYLNISPFLLKKQNKIIGMVSANFVSKEFAMINLMYIKPEYRKQGLGKYLLLNYISYLLKKSKKICLFYSPDNISARYLYKNIGFIKNDSYIMAIPL